MTDTHEIEKKSSLLRNVWYWEVQLKYRVKKFHKKFIVSIPKHCFPTISNTDENQLYSKYAPY